MTQEAASAQQQVWKPREFIAAQVYIVRAGLWQLHKGSDYFGPDDIPEHKTYGNITGNAIKSLEFAHVIRHYERSHPEQGIINGRRHSRRKAAKGRMLSLYTLCSRAAAVEFLRRNGHVIEDRQGELGLAI